MPECTRMGEPLDTVAYLSRSANRVAILRTVDAEPRDRRDLEAEVGVSRSTLSRVLRELETERGWIRRTADGYTTTTAGALVVEQFVPLLETIEALHTVGDALAYLPVDTMSLPVRHFHDATFVRPAEFDPTAPFEYGVDELRASQTLLSVGRTVPQPYVRAISEAVPDDLSVELVVGGAYLDTVAESELATLWDDIVVETAIYRYDGYVPYNLLVLDDVVHLWLCSDQGERAGLLETANSAVREWAIDTVEEYRREAHPLTPGLDAAAADGSGNPD